MDIALKPIEEWTETDILALPTGEFDWLEFKRADFLKGGDWQVRLSKYISAWANYDGGILVIGVRDPEASKPIEFEGGIPDADQRKLGEQLNSVIPRLVEPILARFKFHFVPLDGRKGAALVLQVPPSDDAPHQTADHKYYMRRGKNLDPLRHRMIEDIRGRRKHPTVRTELVFTYGRSRTILAWRIHNVGRILARHVKSVIHFPTTWNGKVILFDSRNGVFYDESEEGSYCLLELSNFTHGPVHPSGLIRGFRYGHLGGIVITPQPKPSIAKITVTTFADEAGPTTETFTVDSIANFSPAADDRDD